jgi:hypothetical protein
MEYIFNAIGVLLLGYLIYRAVRRRGPTSPGRRSGAENEDLRPVAGREGRRAK